MTKLAARHPDLDLKAVTCVGGNVELDQVVVNTLTVLEAADRTDVPVARGAALPLLQPPRSAPHVHGSTASATWTGRDPPVRRTRGTRPGAMTSDPHGAAPTVVQVATAVDGRRYADLWLRTVR
jgi:inosine-uridine nucleoside N-ribohydrolase